MTDSTIKLLITIYFIGFALGGILFPAPDKYGRKWTIVLATFINLIGQFIALYSMSYGGKAFGLFLLGFFHIKTSIAYVYMFENVHSSDKAFCSTIINIVDALPITLTGVYLSWFSKDLLLL